MHYPDWIREPPTALPKTAKELLRRVYDLQQNTGWCFARQQVLAADLGAGLRSIKRAIAQLEAAGYIEVVRAKHRSVHWLTNKMRTTSLEAVMEAAAANVPDADKAKHLRVQRALAYTKQQEVDRDALNKQCALLPTDGETEEAFLFGAAYGNVGQGVTEAVFRTTQQGLWDDEVDGDFGEADHNFD